jgi:hypothetical protein
MIDPEYSKERPYASKEFRIGFAGSVTHIADLIPLLDAVIKLQDYAKFKFVLFGFTDKYSTWPEFVQQNTLQLQKNGLGKGILCRTLVTFGEKLAQIKNLEWNKSVPILDYLPALAALDLDIGTCPLEKTSFNSMKSVCKMLEYAMSGTTCIASAVAPYSDQMNWEWLVKGDAISWEKMLAELMNDKKKLKSIAADQKKWVLENRLADMFTEKRVKAYEALLV